MLRLLSLLSAIISVLAQTMIVGLGGVGKTTIMNHVTGSNFKVCGDIYSCNNGTAVFNNMANIYDFEGFNSYMSRSSYDILTKFFDIMYEHGSIQNVVWVKSCMESRMPAGVAQLLTQLKSMSVQFHLIIHDNKCNGNCLHCTLDESQMSTIYPIASRIKTNHLNKDPLNPDWESVKQDYEQLFRNEKSIVHLPDNYRQILNKDNYEMLIKSWIEDNCASVMKTTKAAVYEIDNSMKDLSAKIVDIYNGMCFSNKMKPQCIVSKRNVSYKCSRDCKTRILGVCVDYKGVWCNRPEEYTTCSDVEDFDARRLEIEACEANKEAYVKNAKNSIDALESHKSKLTTSNEQYMKCLSIMSFT